MKDKNLTAILALLFGSIGVHRFYLGQVGQGLLYFFFCWTFIPTVVAFIDMIVFFAYTQEEFDRKYNPPRIH